MDGLLPASIIWRKDKVGFEPPQKQWMQQANVQEYIHESKKKLVKAGILKQDVLKRQVQPTSAHEAKNFDWQYLCAAHCL
jgi:asparagine synthase (glutamine-hydrolysing)